MKTIHHICNAFFLGFEGFCIMMAVYMTYKQLIMFYQNEDFSQIFIEKFTDGPNDKYPTYTICFNDNFEEQIYTKKHITTAITYYSGAFPYGRRIIIEENKLVVMNRTEASPGFGFGRNGSIDLRINDKYSYGDYNVMQKEETYWNKEPVLGEYEMASTKYDIDQKMRAKRRISTCSTHFGIRPESDSYYDLRHIGNNMLLLKSRQKT